MRSGRLHIAGMTLIPLITWLNFLCRGRRVDVLEKKWFLCADKTSSHSKSDSEPMCLFFIFFLPGPILDPREWGTTYI
ncbi:hypothetical protein PanWU01x14_170570 [Parasponia andersonii]|uniref:Uncharacterized protein n=1 Tax=Parasponia andersonii TaxID=3476 RepID=A0A2P5CAA8_PARAD|nr:hypothetical protein PanWU01x14_170570 [Parasponia andersonii]